MKEENKKKKGKGDGKNNDKSDKAESNINVIDEKNDEQNEKNEIKIDSNNDDKQKKKTKKDKNKNIDKDKNKDKDKSENIENINDKQLKDSNVNNEIVEMEKNKEDLNHIDNKTNNIVQDTNIAIKENINKGKIFLKIEIDFENVKQNILQNLIKFDERINGILDLPENNKKNLDIKSYVEKYHREMNALKRKEELSEKLNEKENRKFFKTQDNKAVVNNQNNSLVANENINKSTLKRLAESSKYSPYNIIKDADNEKDKDRIWRNYNNTNVSRVDQNNNDNRSISRKSKKSEKSKDSNIKEDEKSIVKLKDTKEYASILNATRKEFIQNLDSDQIKNYIDVKNKNQSISKYDIVQHNKKIEELKDKIVLKKRLKAAEIKEGNPNFNIKSSYKKQNIDITLLQKELLKANKSRSKSNSNSKSSKRSKDSNKVNENRDYLCLEKEKEIKMKKLKSHNTKIQTVKCAQLIKEFIPIGFDPAKKRELEERIKKLNMPKTRLDILKKKSLNDVNSPNKFDSRTGKLLVPNYLEIVKEDLLKKKSDKELVENIIKTNKKLEPIRFSPTCRVYRGSKPKKTIPKIPLDYYPDYLSHNIQTSVDGIYLDYDDNSSYSKEKQIYKKWNKVLKKGNISQSLNTMKHSVNYIDEKIKRNKMVLNNNSYKENVYKNNAVNARVSQETGDLLVESINAKLAMLDIIPAD